MIKRKIYFLVIIIGMMSAQNINAQKDRTSYLIKSAFRGLEYEIKAGFSIGGVSPIPLPSEIRELVSFHPTLLIAIEANATKWFNDEWGIESGIRLEDKGMKTDARVKNYNMEMTAEDGGFMKGAWTGYVSTKVRNSYITFPILATYKISPRWVIKGGVFMSYMAEGQFSGLAYDGYLRNGDPTGQKINVTEASYDFSDDLRRFAWGGQLSGEWRAFKHLNVYADLTWGANDVFKKSFKIIEFNMYPIYLNMGFGYVF